MNGFYYAILGGTIIPQISGTIQWDVKDAPKAELELPAVYLPDSSLVGELIQVYWYGRMMFVGAVNKPPAIDFDGNNTKIAKIQCIGGHGGLSFLRAYPKAIYSDALIADILDDLETNFEFYDTSDEFFVTKEYPTQTVLEGDYDFSGAETRLSQLRQLAETLNANAYPTEAYVPSRAESSSYFRINSTFVEEPVEYDFLKAHYPLFAYYNKFTSSIDLERFSDSDSRVSIGFQGRVLDGVSPTSTAFNKRFPIQLIEGENYFDVEFSDSSEDVYYAVEAYGVIGDEIITLNYALGDYRTHEIGFLDQYPIDRPFDLETDDEIWLCYNTNIPEIAKTIRKKFSLNSQLSTVPTAQELTLAGYELYLKTIQFLDQSNSFKRFTGSAFLLNNIIYPGQPARIYLKTRQDYNFSPTLNRVQEVEVDRNVDDFVFITSVTHEIGEMVRHNGHDMLVWKIEASQNNSLSSSSYDSELELFEKTKQSESGIDTTLIVGTYEATVNLDGTLSADATIFNPNDAKSFSITSPAPPGGSVSVFAYAVIEDEGAFEDLGVEVYMEYTISGTPGDPITGKITVRDIGETTYIWDATARPPVIPIRGFFGFRSF